MSPNRFIFLALALVVLGCKKDAPTGQNGNTGPSTSGPTNGDSKPGSAVIAPPSSLKGDDLKLPPSVKLMTLDLTPYGIRAVIDVPEGAMVNPKYGIGIIDYVYIRYGDWFNLAFSSCLRRSIEQIKKEYGTVGGFRGWKAKEFPIDTADELMAQTVENKFRIHRLIECAGEIFDIVQYKSNSRAIAEFHLSSARSFRETAEQKQLNQRDAAARNKFIKAHGVIVRDPSSQRLTASLASNEIGDEAINFLKDLPIEAIVLRDAPELTAKGFEKFIHLSQLKEFDFSGDNVDDTLLTEVGRLSKLKIEKISLEDTIATEKGFKALAKLSSLRVLIVRGENSGLTSAAWETLSEMENLEELKLSSQSVTDATLRHLGGLKKMKELNLSNTEVSDAVFPLLKGMKNLTDLDLSDTKITSSGIANLKDSANLFSLLVTSTPDMEKAVEELQKVLPNLRMVRYYTRK